MHAMYLYPCCLGHQKNISCDFSVANTCEWKTSFHVRNSQATSLLLDHTTNSLNTGTTTTTVFCTFIYNSHIYTGGYVFIRGNQIIGGTKIFLTLDDVTSSVINEIFFVYQLNGSVSITLQTSSRTIWSSTSNPGVPTGVGDWLQVRLYAGSLYTSNTPINLQFVATGSSSGFAAVDDLIIQVQSHCNYDALSDPG